MLFRRADYLLLLEMDTEGGFRLHLHLRGVQPAKVMLVLIAGVETLITDWLKVKVVAHVPCIHCLAGTA